VGWALGCSERVAEVSLREAGQSGSAQPSEEPPRWRPEERPSSRRLAQRHRMCRRPRRERPWGASRTPVSGWRGRDRASVIP